MTITVNLHPSWHLPSVFAALAALESPRAPGDDLSELLDGIDAPEPQPAPSPATRPAAQPAPRQTAQPFDGAPVTGPQLYKWACNHKALPTVNRLAKTHGFGHRVVDLTPEEVAILYRDLTAEPAANGAAR
jgi:hypothetical protein